MKNANNEAITIPHEIFINNPENIESEVATFISYLPELMSEVTATAIPTIIDLKVTCGDKTSTIKLPIIPFNFKSIENYEWIIKFCIYPLIILVISIFALVQRIKKIGNNKYYYEEGVFKKY